MARLTCVSTIAAPRSPTTIDELTTFRKSQTRGETPSSLPYVRGPKGFSIDLSEVPAPDHEHGEPERDAPPYQAIRRGLDVRRGPAARIAHLVRDHLVDE